MELKRIQTALISVFFKDGIEELATYLHQNGVKILSTGGTQQYLEDLGIPVTTVESLTSHPSILGGRVKTLHPAVFGGILNRSDNANDQSELVKHGIGNIDLIWVDLYPFAETVQSTDNEATIIEKIDIGGVSLIRAAAKNYKDKLVVSGPDQPSEVIRHLSENNCSSDVQFRRSMAGMAFDTTRIYDSHISAYFNDEKSTALRYGENPHQSAQFKGNLNKVFSQIHGKAISYNNLLDIDAAIGLINDYSEIEGHVFAILKHNNACGLSIRQTLKQSYVDALAGDPISAFGGILATHSTIDAETAQLMDELFFEVILAPDFDSEALHILKTKKNRIILKTEKFAFPNLHKRSVLNGLLEQKRDDDVNDISSFQEVTNSPPTDEVRKDLFFANVAVKHTKSNAIVLAKNNQLLASGTGQTSRIDALNQAIAKANAFGFDLNGAVMASDAFFPFPDCVEIAHKAGIRAVIQPGGSIKDQLSIDYCNEHGLAMVVTGMRHFKH